MSKKLVFAMATCVTMNSLSPMQFPSNINVQNCKKPFIRKASSTRTNDFSFNMSNTRDIKKSSDIIPRQSTVKNRDQYNKYDLYAEAIDIFGGFRNLTKEEEEAYSKGLKEISKPTGKRLTL